MDFLKKLPTPQEVMLKYPLNKEYTRQKILRDREIKNIFEGKSDKFILVIGPCSADRENVVLDYMQRLSGLQEKVKETFLIIPRVYTSKPRTIGDGYKGLLHQPFLDRGEDIVEGIVAVRLIHKRVIEETGLFGADEMLYPEVIGYISDLISYIAVGARSVENQQHRLVASGLNVPIGMKNPINGDVTVMLNSIVTAQRPHHFIYHGWEVISQGNRYAHAILRGGIDFQGNSIPNYHYEDLMKLYELYSSRNLENISLVVDCNHNNSNKNYLEQENVAKNVIDSMRKAEIITKMVKGLMIESYIEDGSQPVDGTIYGKSITDACLGWEKTEKLVLKLAEELKK
jgi:3-deoxy-7-phosphoheptulonate synthase